MSVVADPTRDGGEVERSEERRARPDVRRAVLLASGLPALAILAASFVQTELLHGSWDRLNAIISVGNPVRSNVNDALPAMEAARALLETPGAPIYDMSRTDSAAFLYPPIAAALYVPHVLAGDDALWSLVSWNRVVFVLIALLLLGALVGPARRWPKPVEVLGVAAAMVLFLPAARALELNQASLYVGLFVGAAWVALDRGAEATAGVLLACAGAVKPHMFAVAPLLFFHARRAAVSAAVAGGGLLAASIAFAGLPNHVTYVTHVLPEASRGYAFFPNQSFGGMLHRLLSDVPLDTFELMPANPLVMRATLVVGAVLYGVTFVVLLRARGRRDLAREAFAVGWLVTTMIAPIAWGHHYVAALFPLAWLVGRVRDGVERSAARLAPVAIGCALVGSYFVVDGLRGAGARLLASYGLFGALLAAGALAWRLVQAGGSLAGNDSRLASSTCASPASSSAVSSSAVSSSAVSSSPPA
ncbi:MAG: glycosyltransferase family 87 protein [Polyangiaceae bacterium]